MESNSNMVKIKEIHDNFIEINDSSFIWFIALTAVGVIVFSYILWFLFKLITKKREENRCKIYLKALNDIDWSNPKRDSYRVTEYGRYLADKDEKVKEVFFNLLPFLEKYKYRREVQDEVDRETLREFELFKQVCNESV